MSFPAGCISGFDVSYANGTVNWAQAAAAGERFAYIKASEGVTVQDATFALNWRNSRQAGLLRGPYHFFHPNDAAQAQVDNFLNQLQAANGSCVLGPGDLPAALDVEVGDGVAAAGIVAGMTAWLSAVEQATGRTPVIYTYSSFWTASVEHVPAFSRFPLWIARYGPPPVVPATWHDWTMWQWSTNPTAWHPSAGIDSNAFKGDMNALRAFAGLPALPAVPGSTPAAAH